MEWHELSKEAQLIISSVENIITGEHQLVDIVLGRQYIIFNNKSSYIVTVTREIVDEITKFASENKNLSCEVSIKLSKGVLNSCKLSNQI